VCSIAGILTESVQVLSPEDTRDRLLRMSRAMASRGPDASNLWMENGVAFAHNRLSIIDLETRSNQPMSCPSGNHIVFNGEIYNYRELRSELQEGYAFRTESDTEVILAAYEKWGVECVHHFNGDWAFAIYDRRRDVVFASRDRFGIKPFYYSKQSREFIFASEIKALLAAGVPGRVRKRDLARFLKYKKNEWPYETLLMDIEPLPPGHCLEVDARLSVRQWRYYDQERLVSADVPQSLNEGVEVFRQILKDSVSLRLRADVPVGVCLSGGMDSSAIVALAAEMVDRPIHTFSGVFPGTDFDESMYSQAVAEAYKTQHTPIAPTISDFYSSFQPFVLAQDSPHGSTSTVARYLVVKRASQDVKVVLDGQGGDEIFGGYNSCFKVYRQHYEKAAGVPLRVDVRKNPKKSSRFEPLAEVGFSSEVVTRRQDTPVGWGEPLLVQQYKLLRNNLLSLLHTEDRMTMTHSIEGRVPLLDHRLVEYCFSTPVSFRFYDFDKRLLREWLRSDPRFPQAIVERTDKKGFSSDFNQQLRLESSLDWWVSELESWAAKRGDLFSMSVLKSLLEEQMQDGVDNVDRLLAALSVMIYFSEYNIELVGDL
jgi:asparagine synthase (glutamine-hydrolysing)